jgi:tellurite resistance protein
VKADTSVFVASPQNRRGSRDRRNIIVTMTGRLPLNFFGISFGLAGLAGTWTTATTLHSGPKLVGDVLWAVALAVWLTLLVWYLTRPGGPAAIRADLLHPVLGPFGALVPLTGLLFAGRLTTLTGTGGRIVVGILLTVATVYAGWFLRTLLGGDLHVDHVHPGYLLPTAAAGLIGAQAAAVVGWRDLAVAAFGVGLLFWGLTGAVLLARLAIRPQLPAQVLPTMAIFSAPPAVAGNAWFAISGGRPGKIGEVFLGIMVILLLLQVLHVPAYVRIPFGPGFWALTFTTAASATYGVRWLTGTPPVLSWLLVAVASTILAVVAVATSRASARRDHHVVAVAAPVPVE